MGGRASGIGAWTIDHIKIGIRLHRDPSKEEDTRLRTMFITRCEVGHRLIAQFLSSPIAFAVQLLKR